MIGAGLGLQFAGWLGAAFFPIELIRRGFPLMISLGLIVIIVGCAKLAEAKGHSKLLGLLGLFSLLGIAVVWFVLPDRSGPR